ncbi:FCD domain-containing protein [Marinomonas sp. 2405UD68-3]|uniref:FCD domain-containing protein n=1 Tax=Marinomonas sp. 2405UD68-3 TaxID=3391835 RepID=UPI0039C90829
MSSSSRRYQQVGKQIRNTLLSGELPTGGRLPSERDLSERYNASRATIREAIIMLELQGLVEVKQGAGIFFVENVGANSIIGEAESEIGPFELLQARQLLETNIASFAATQISASHVREMRDLLRAQELEINGDSKHFNELDHNFHMVIADATQNNMLIQMAQSMWDNVRTANPLWDALNEQYFHEKRLQSLWLSDHKNILIALQKRSPIETKQAVWQHIENAKKELFKLANVEEPDFEGFLFAANAVPTLHNEK